MPQYDSTLYSYALQNIQAQLAQRQQKAAQQEQQRQALFEKLLMQSEQSANRMREEQQRQMGVAAEKGKTAAMLGQEAPTGYVDPATQEMAGVGHGQGLAALAEARRKQAGELEKVNREGVLKATLAHQQNVYDETAREDDWTHRTGLAEMEIAGRLAVAKKRFSAQTQNKLSAMAAREDAKFHNGVMDMVRNVRDIPQEVRVKLGGRGIADLTAAAQRLWQLYDGVRREYMAAQLAKGENPLDDLGSVMEMHRYIHKRVPELNSLAATLRSVGVKVEKALSDADAAGGGGEGGSDGDAGDFDRKD